jgi:hypothetical protein
MSASTQKNLEFQVVQQTPTQLQLQKGFLSRRDALHHELKMFLVLPSFGIIVLLLVPLIGKFHIAAGLGGMQPNTLLTVVVFSVVAGVGMVLWGTLINPFFVSLSFNRTSGELVRTTKNFFGAKTNRYSLDKFANVNVREKTEVSTYICALELIQLSKKALIVDKASYPLEQKENAFKNYSEVAESIRKFMKWNSFP